MVRELREELGLTIEVMGIRCVAYKAYDSNLSLVYRCRIVSGDPIPDGTEIEAWGYFPLESFPASLSDRTKRIVQAGLTESLNINVITFKKP